MKNFSRPYFVRPYLVRRFFFKEIAFFAMLLANLSCLAGDNFSTGSAVYDQVVCETKEVLFAGSQDKKAHIEALVKFVSQYPEKDLSFLILVGSHGGWYLPVLKADSSSRTDDIAGQHRRPHLYTKGVENLEDLLSELKDESQKQAARILLLNCYIQACDLGAIYHIHMPRNMRTKKERITKLLKTSRNLPAFNALIDYLMLKDIQVKSTVKGRDKTKAFLDTEDELTNEVTAYAALINSVKETRIKYTGTPPESWFIFINYRFLLTAPQFFDRSAEGNYADNAPRNIKIMHQELSKIPEVNPPAVCGKIISVKCYARVLTMLRMASGFDQTASIDVGKQLLKDYPNLPPDVKGELLIGLGYAEMGLHHYKSALDYFQEAARTDPNNGDAKYKIGWAKILLKDDKSSSQPVLPRRR